MVFYVFFQLLPPSYYTMLMKKYDGVKMIPPSCLRLCSSSGSKVNNINHVAVIPIERACDVRARLNRFSDADLRAYRFRLARGRGRQDARIIGRRAGSAAIVAGVVGAVVAVIVVGGAIAGAGGSYGRLIDTGRRDRRSRGWWFARRDGLWLRCTTVARSVTRRSVHDQTTCSFTSLGRSCSQFCEARARMHLMRYLS